MDESLNEDRNNEDQLRAHNDPPAPYTLSSIFGSIRLGIFFMSTIVLTLAASVTLHVHYFGVVGELTQMNLESYGSRIEWISEKDEFQPNSFLGILPIRNKHHIRPEIMMQYENPIPGKCWKFREEEGQVIMRLCRPSLVQGFVLEHIAKYQDPSGDINSAPKHFNVYGFHEFSAWSEIRDLFWKSSENRVLLGEFKFLKNGPSKQYFPISSNTTWEIIDLTILSNYGGDHTCVYKFRVMGKPSSCIHLNN